MWYAVYWNQDMTKIMGFIVDDEALPKSWESKTEAMADLKDHMLRPYVEFVEF